MKPRSFLALSLTFALLSGVFAAEKVQRRTLNDGNLILEDIPEIPASIGQDLNRYQNMRSAAFLDWSQDSKSIYISTRFGNVSQIHRVDFPKADRTQLTFFNEPVAGAVRRPESGALTFLMDSGGSEFTQIYEFNPATGESKLLTDGKSRNESLRWSRDGKRLAFKSTRRNGQSNDIWMMEPPGNLLAKLLVEAPNGNYWTPVDWSADGKQLLVEEYVSIRESRLYQVDTESGARQLLEGEKVSVNHGIGYDRDGTGYFFLTDQQGNFNQLAHRVFGRPDVQILTPAIPWDVEGAAFTPARDRLAFVVNEDGWNSLYLMDATTFQMKKVDGLPQGVMGGLEFSPDGHQLGFTLNTPTSPSDAYSLELGDLALEYGKVTRWTFSETGGLDTSKFSLPQLVRFPSFDGLSVPAFVYKPSGQGPHPVIIKIHGGPEGQFQPVFSSATQLWIDKLGAAVIGPNVRGSSGYGKEYVDLDNGMLRENSVKDIGALLDWIKTQPDLDANRVAVYGGSYGGFMVLSCATHFSGRLKAAVDLVGISNFVTFLENTQGYRRDLRRVEYGDERDPAMREFLRTISPKENVGKIAIPLLVIQGQNDPRVPVTESEQMVKALRDQGKPVWYLNALDEGHGYRKKANVDVSEQAVVMFFRTFLLK